MQRLKEARRAIQAVHTGREALVAEPDRDRCEKKYEDVDGTGRTLHV